jgi:hypothetical protein
MLTYKNPKAKPCEVCQNLFVPDRMGQAVCRPACAMKKVRQEKVDERAKVRTRKEAIKTIPELIKEAQREFNAYIRARDRDQPCISCGAPPPDLSGLHAGRDAGHYRSVGSASHLRFHEDNVHAQCVHCNQWGAGRAVDYRIGLLDRLDLARVEALEHNNTPHKWTQEELRGIRDTYRAKLKEMRK